MHRAGGSITKLSGRLGFPSNNTPFRRACYRLPGLARLRHANSIERCPLSGVTRKTFAQTEFFRL